MTAGVAQAPVLALEDVEVRFPVAADWLGRPSQFAHAINGVSLDVRPGEVLGIVGESGCGKSTLAQLLMGLLAPTDGQVRRPGAGQGKANVQIVFQDPQSSLDPRLPVWRVIVEPIYVRDGGRLSALRSRAVELAGQVGLRAEQLDRYVHEFSGGQRQRIAIARALSSSPDVIVLDEPTSALDISVQAQILNLLLDLQRTFQLTYVLISHNVSVVRHLCHRVAVMYLGQIVEIGAARDVLGDPKHPYTRVLLDAVPRLGEPFVDGSPAVNTELPGNRNLPTGCFFRDRCPLATAGCDKPQVLRPLAGEALRSCRCHLVA